MQDKQAPKDKIRFVEMIIHNFGEMKTVPGLETDEDFQLEIDDQTTLFQGVRSRYIGDVYKYNKRWAEALAVYERSADYVKRSLKGKRRECFPKQGKWHNSNFCNFVNCCFSLCSRFIFWVWISRPCKTHGNIL